MKKLKDPRASIARFFETVAGLGDRAGPVLFQLPPHWRVNTARLDAFLQALPDHYRYAFEFRDPSWFTPAVFDLLSRHRAAFCLYELAGAQTPVEVTTDFVYVRLHGPGDAYAGCYDEAALARWAERLAAWANSGTSAWCYFDNDERGYAFANARTLKALVGELQAR